MVGVTGFEPATPRSRTVCSTRLSHTPTQYVPGMIDLYLIASVSPGGQALCTELGVGGWELGVSEDVLMAIVEVKVSF